MAGKKSPRGRRQTLRRKTPREGVRDARYRALADLTADWYWEQDAQFRFIEVPEEAARRPQTRPPAVTGLTRWEIPGASLGDEQWAAHRADLEAHRPFQGFEYQRRSVNGEMRWVSISGHPIFDARGQFRGYRGIGRDITGQKRAEQRLTESEERFRSLVALATDFYWETDADHRLTSVSRGGKPFAGVGPANVGKKPWDIPSTAPDAAGWRAQRERMDAHLPFRDFEVTRIAEDGTESHLAISGEPILAPGGRFLGYRGVGSNITARKTEERLLALEHAVAHELSLGNPPDATIRAVLREICQTASWQCARYFGLDRASNAMRFVSAWHVDTPEMRRFASKSRDLAYTFEHPSLVAEAWRSGQPLWVPDAYKDSRVAMQVMAREAGVHGALIFPVVFEESVIGVVSISSTTVRAPNERLLGAFRTIGHQLGQFLRRVSSESQVAFMSQFDALTGLPNRGVLADRLSQSLAQARRRNALVGVLLVDLDDFKLANNAVGHAGADALLKEMAKRMQETLRPGDTLGRVAGDQYAVVLADLARPDDAGLVATKLMERIAMPVAVGERELFVTASIGVSVFPNDADTADGLLDGAEAAMHRAKQSARSTFQFFTRELTERARGKAQLLVDLRRALDREEFAVVYQPKLLLASGKACGAEALLRWRHPARGLVSPAEFVPALEESGLIVPVGDWVLRRVAEDMRGWKTRGLPDFPVAVNLSARQFGSVDLAARIAAIAESAGVSEALIEIEITETQLMREPERAIEIMQSLAQLGMRIAIDDFGTGYSSLAYLSRFPVGALKVDRSFVSNVLEDPADAAIVRAVVDMAHTLGFVVIAEGVESEAQAEFLRNLGCDQAQGFLYARPVPSQELARFVRESLSGTPRS